MKLVPKQFLGEMVTVEFREELVFPRKPPCPRQFEWKGTVHIVEELLAEWRDHTRKGRMSRNMRESHLRRAAQTGSWGVGRIYFRVRVQTGRFFDLYYDRAPAGNAVQGQWFLYRELMPETEDE